MNRRSSLRTLSTLAFAALVGAGCAENEDAPRTATVIVETSPQEALELVVSTRFEVPAPGQIVFVNADTIVITGNYNDEIALNEEGRFTAKLANFGEVETPVRLSVLLDGRLEYDETATILNGGFLQYLYRFQQQVGLITN